MTQEKAERRAKALVAQMTAEEKVSQMLYESPAIPRLKLPAYNWWNEALHGVARAGLATVFPQAIGLAATFDPALVEEIGGVIGRQGRLKNTIYRAEGDRGIYKGLTYWSPNINIVRDPRWGRAHETYGEDPFLTAAMATAFVRGVQKECEGRPQAAACIKHFAVHSGPEETRHGFDAKVSEKDLRETYLPAFEYVIRNAKVAGVMSAYNAVNGVPVCANGRLQQDILREEWGFTGYTVSDCGAIADISERHHYTATKVQAAAAALRAGCDLNCGSMYGYLLEALHQGLIEEVDLDRAVTRLLTVRLQLDMEEPVSAQQEQKALQTWLYEQPEWDALNQKAAIQSMVLLKNDGILPLKEPGCIAVIGPNARSLSVLDGNYHGTAQQKVSVLEGLRARLPHTDFLVSEGCHLYRDRLEAMSAVPDDQLKEAVAFARCADLSVVCLGLDPSIEGELGDASNEYAAGDKKDLRLPASQRRLLQAVCQVSRQVVVVLLSGGAIDLGEENERVNAIVQAWYPGALGGLAVADVLTGAANPTGRLPVTFYRNEQVSWDFEDYAMEGKTYRFFQEEPLYPFGYGLSYEKLELEVPEAAPEAPKDIVTVLTYNPHSHRVDMPLQVYAEFPDERGGTPQRQLVHVSMLSLEAGERKEVTWRPDPYWLSVVEKDGTRRPVKGRVRLWIGDHQPDARSEALAHSRCLSVVFHRGS